MFRYLAIAAVVAVSLLSLPQAEAGHCGNFGAQGFGFHGHNFGGASISTVTVRRRGGRVVQKTVIRR